MNSKTFSAIILVTQALTMLVVLVAYASGIRQVSIGSVMLGDFSALCTAALLFMEVRCRRG